MPTSRPLLLGAVLLALAPSAAFAQAADDPAAGGDDPVAASAPVDDPCDAACQADDAAAAAADAEDGADDPGAADDATDLDDAADDADDDGDADAPPPAGSLDAALDTGWVTAGTFRAPGAGRLRVVLVASRGATAPVLGRAAFRTGHRSSLALELKLTRAGEQLLADAEADVSLVARTTWTAKRSHRTRTTERVVALPLAG